MTPFVLQQRPDPSYESLADDLLVAFRALLAAVIDGRPAVVVVREADLAGHGEPAAAALAHGLLGLVRALAIEGARDGWTINALSIGEGEPPQLWIDQLSTAGPRGALLPLGDGHLGRLPT